MPKTHTSPKLGICGHVPAVPLMPVAAQLANASHGTLHLKFDGGDAYVSTQLPSIPPSRIKAVVAAIKACPTEPTWSGTGSTYYRLTVTPDPEHGRAQLVAGSVSIGYVMVVAEAEIVSGDEPMTDQLNDGDETDGPDTGAVN